MKNDSTKLALNETSSRKEKIRRKMPLKIVLRRLPAAMTWEQLETQLNPIPEFEFSEFVAAKSSGGISFSRVYFVFKNDDDIIAFKERFHGYVFVDNKDTLQRQWDNEKKIIDLKCDTVETGEESVGIVELAPNPKVPRDKLETAKKRDLKCGTIETDHEYKKFLSERQNPQKPDLVSMEQLIRDIDEKEKMIEKNAVQETPLTQYMIRKSIKRIEEKRRAREEGKRERMERRYENELKDKQDRQEIKKMTEFRNSRFERSHESSVKEKERTKIRTYRSSDYNRNGIMEKSSMWYDIDDRGKSNQLSKKGRDASASRDIFLKKTKQNDDNRDSKAEKIEEMERDKKIKKEDEAITKKIISSEDIIEPTPEKLSIKVSKVVNRMPAHKITIAQKNSKRPDNEGKEEKTENDFTKPRRNKDRPERAIYQPSAVRRRVAVLAASGPNATEKIASDSKEKP